MQALQAEDSTLSVPCHAMQVSAQVMGSDLELVLQELQRMKFLQDIGNANWSGLSNHRPVRVIIQPGRRS